MARVNHKLVKQRLNEKRSKITDKQFFSSRMLAGHFEDLAAAQTRRYHYNRRVRVNLYWKPKDAFTAATDNMQIRINTGHPLVTKVKGRENRYQLVCGMFAHELGHVLFTDFLSAQTYHNYLDSFKWYPRPPAFRLAADARNEKAFWEYVKEDPKNLQMVHQIAANTANIIEDGYIENRMLNSFPGTLGYGLETLRERHFDEIDTVTELIAKETDDGRHICGFRQQGKKTSAGILCGAGILLRIRSDTPNSRKRSNVANYPMSSMVSFERTDFFAAASAPMQPVKPWTNTLPA